MEYLNHKITEAVCAFRFDPSKNSWDWTSYAEFYKLIKEKGFIKRNEIKPIQLSFHFKPNEAPKNPDLVEGETQMVFKNNKEDRAILISNNYISFHTIGNYPGWDVFSNEFISNIITSYFDLGYGNGLDNAQMIYINNFDLKADKKLSNYLTFVPDMDHFGEGDEVSHMFQSAYQIAPNKRLQLKTILNVINPERIKKVLLECNCIAFNTLKHEINWSELANDAHHNAKNAFINITTPYFKNLIK
ncbi:MAG: TIGR04255 family protein [Bacteroidales bacterium]|nr:TIGR04255 family protein [Bacteroidales bacterium]MCF8455346.1 TIGR04255 family protein [Bacteroidales bacterium]